jgi:hypothetical protein
LSVNAREPAYIRRVAPEPAEWRELSEPLVVCPVLPPRYRVSGLDATPEAPRLRAEQLAASPRAKVDPADVEALHGSAAAA